MVLQAQAPPEVGIKTVFYVDGIQTLVPLGTSFEIRNGKLEIIQQQPAYTEITGERLPWDNVRLGWILPPGTLSNIRVIFYGHRLRGKLAFEQDTSWDYEIIGDLVKPQRNPWPSVYHTYFDYRKLN